MTQTRTICSRTFAYVITKCADYYRGKRGFQLSQIKPETLFFVVPSKRNLRRVLLTGPPGSEIQEDQSFLKPLPFIGLFSKSMGADKRAPWTIYCESLKDLLKTRLFRLLKGLLSIDVSIDLLRRNTQRASLLHSRCMLMAYGKLPKISMMYKTSYFRIVLSTYY